MWTWGERKRMRVIVSAGSLSLGEEDIFLLFVVFLPR